MMSGSIQSQLLVVPLRMMVKTMTPFDSYNWLEWYSVSGLVKATLMT